MEYILLTIFEYNIDKRIPENLICDQVKIKQILSNLLSNSAKYTF